MYIFGFTLTGCFCTNGYNSIPVQLIMSTKHECLVDVLYHKPQICRQRPSALGRRRDTLAEGPQVW